MSTTSSLHLHPLVLVNISDHFVRNGTTGAPTIGCLIGYQESQRVSITDSFDVVVSKRGEKNELVIEAEDVTAKLELFRRIFPQSELLGWYSIGNEASAAHMTIHKQFQTWNESPFFLLLSPAKATSSSKSASSSSSSSSSASKDALPLSIQQIAMQIVDEVHSAVWTPVTYKIETDDSERVTVDHVLSSGNGGQNSSSSTSTTTTTSTLDPHVHSLHNAITMLRSRMTIIREFLNQTREGKIPPDHALIREANALCSQLPLLEAEVVDEMFLGELGDSLLINYLATATKASAAMAGVVAKYTVIAAENNQDENSSSSSKKQAELGDGDSVNNPHLHFRGPRLSGFGMESSGMRFVSTTMRGGGGPAQPFTATSARGGGGGGGGGSQQGGRG